MLESERLRLFQYNGWTFVQVSRIELPMVKSQEFLFSVRLRPFIFENEPYFCKKLLKSFNIKCVKWLSFLFFHFYTALSSFGSNENFPGGLYSVQFDTRNDYSTLSTGLEKWCGAARRRLNGIDVPTLAQFLEKAPKLHDKTLELKGPISFRGPLTTRSLLTKVSDTRKI